MVAVVASLALAAVFLVAGGSKIVAGEGWLRQAADLGAPAPVARVVPWWEVAIGALLAVQLASVWVAAAALATLVAFTVLLVVRLAQGRRPACACFGVWSVAPIGWRHVARNAAFAALAIAVIAAG